ncbi:exosome complex exonuclease Rrp41 [Methanosarcina sp. Z-7115]|uniref:Exosome complex component Rrp41 n=1 Tax=Methanosarcina baikalica TaxID=3073890 RepID=A0ABU2D2R6_9EURY|nr:exosome complex exonuclease Rrp41 [Methanosarcina sp. Z-7115]MDR7666279.1 exosome complex exonuclease Rrp41 [Methanosarcina sp. Z-7115]
MSDKPEKLITDDGLRLDGRRADEIRPMKIEIGVLSRADGSCYLEWGRNKILVGVFGPREAHPRRSQRADTAVIRYKYNMASFSVEDRARPGPSRRSIEISKVSREAFEPVIMAELFPKTAIDIFVEVLQADAGTRTAAINASSVALADAGIPMKGLITSCAFGKIDGKIVLDLNKDEDNYGDADFPVAMTQDGEITLVQMDGHLTPEEIREGLELVKKGCKEILEIQQAVLRKKFETPMGELAEEAAETSNTENEVVEAEAPLEYASKVAVVEEALKETEEFEDAVSEDISEAGAVTEAVPELDELEEIIKEAEAGIEEETIEEVIESEIEEKAEEDEADFEASFEASFEEVSEPDEVEELEPEEAVSGEEETGFESEIEEFVEEEPQPAEELQVEEEAGIEEAASEETLESEPEVESEAESREEAPAEELEAEEESVEEPEEEKCEGPWKVVKDPSESGSRGEKDE